MTAATTAQNGLPARQRPAQTGRARLSWAGTLNSEWIKIRSLRSSWWTLLIAVFVLAGIAFLVALTYTSSGDDPDADGVQATASVYGYLFAQLSIAVFGALTIAGEYTTGAIRSTYSSVPRRTPALVSKALVVFLVSGVVAAVGVAASFVLGQPFYSGTRGATSSLSDAGTWLTLGGAVLYLATMGVLAVGIGAILRNSTGAVFSLVALIFVVPMIVQMVGFMANIGWLLDVGQFLPSAAGERLFGMATVSSLDGTQLLGPWQGYLVFLAWAVIATLVGITLTKKRDV